MAACTGREPDASSLTLREGREEYFETRGRGRTTKVRKQTVSLSGWSSEAAQRRPGDGSRAGKRQGSWKPVTIPGFQKPTHNGQQPQL